MRTIEAINFGDNQTIRVNDGVDKIEKHGCYEVYYKSGRMAEIYNVNWVQLSKLKED